MPSQILHTMFGEDILSLLDISLTGEKTLLYTKKLLSDFRHAFVLGCQGPDIFYHNQRSIPLALHYGSLLHRRGFGSFSANLLKTALVGAEISAKGAYAFGFVTHAFLDRACHPYIIYKGKDYHSFFERIIDVLMLKQLRGLEPALWDQQKVLAEVCENPPPGFKEMVAFCLVETFPEKAGRDGKLARRIDNAFKDAARFYNLSSPIKIAEDASAALPEKRFVITRRALNYMYPENLPDDIDFLNLKRTSWCYPHISSNGEKPKEDTRSFVEIYHDAVKTAVDVIAPIINQYIETAAFPIDTAEKIGNQGLSIVNEENGRPCAPNITEPLPLTKVMEQQRKLRGVE